jgi:hypothetical protein
MLNMQTMPAYWSQAPGMGCASCAGLGQDGTDGGSTTDSTDSSTDSTTLDYSGAPALATPVTTFGPTDAQLGINSTTLPMPWGGDENFGSGVTLPQTTANVTPSSSMSASEATAISNLAAGFTKIFGNVIAPQTTITQTPQGLQVSTPAGQTSNLASVLGGASLLGASATSWVPLIVIAGIGIGGLMLISSAMRR